MIFRIRTLVFALLYLVSPDTFSQVVNKDSLLQLLSNQKEDTNKVNLLFEIGDAFDSSSPDSAKQYIRIAGRLSKDLNYTKGTQKFFRRIAYVHVVQSEFDSVLYYNKLGLELATQERDTFSMGVSLFNMGIAYRFMTDYENAVKYSLEGANLLEGKGYSHIESSLYDGLQVLYMSLAQYDKAIMYGEKAVQIARETNDQTNLSIALNNLALSFMDADRIPDARKVLQEALMISTAVDNKSVAGSALNNLAEIAMREGNYPSLKKYAEQSLQLHTELEALDGLTISNRYIAQYYLSQKDYDKARQYCQAAFEIADTNNFLNEKSQCYKVFASIAFATHNILEGNQYLLKSKQLDEKIFTESLAEKESAMKVKFESEKKEIIIKELEADKKVSELTIQQKNFVNYFLIGSVVTILVISLLSYRSYKQKQLLNEQQISKLEKEKQLAASEAVIRGQEEERGRLARDLHDGLGGMLSGVKFSLTNMKTNVVLTADHALVFERSLDMLDHSITELRRVAHNMMPEVLVKFGLTEALKSYCESLRQSGIFQIDFQSLGAGERQSSSTEIILYRIVQELLNNIAKHSGATRVLVQLAWQEKEINITVEDNGSGFDSDVLEKTTGLGWSNIRSRVEYLKGKVDVQSGNGQGTSVHLSVPI